MSKNSSVISEQNKQNLLELKFGGKKIKRGKEEPEVEVDDMLEEMIKEIERIHRDYVSTG